MERFEYVFKFCLLFVTFSVPVAFVVALVLRGCIWVIDSFLTDSFLTDREKEKEDGQRNDG